MNDVNKLKQALQFVLKQEGGYVNNVYDPGGETKWGISKKAYPNLNIKTLTPEQALQIYQRDYWNPVGGDNLPLPICVVALDCAVLCGVSITRYWLREDGMDWRTILFDRKKYHLSRISQSPRLRVFLQGWLQRLLALKKYCETWEQANGFDSSAVGP